MAAVGMPEGLNWSLQLVSSTLPPVLVYHGSTDEPSKLLWSADRQQLFYAFHDGPLALVRSDGSPIQTYSTQFLSTGYGYWAPCNSY